MAKFGALAAAMAGLALATAAPARSQPAPTYTPAEGDFTIANFHFRSGETLPQLRLHYSTLGTPRRDAAGHVTNAVMLLHGTGGAGWQFLRPYFAGELFGPGQPLDITRYFIIMPDDIGHGKSSKPSDGMHMRFPRYGYADMVDAEHALATDGLHVDHLRLILGTSMGCMHAFVWGETYPDAMDALAPFACLPVPIMGRNRLWRDMIVSAIESDPAWKGGDYTEQPKAGLTTAADILALAGSAPHQMQPDLPTQAAVDKRLADIVGNALRDDDADDLIYQLNSSKDYDPSARLEAIKARVLWINSADDFINPPELRIAEREAPRLKNGRFVLIPIGPTTHGHGTHTWAVNWKDKLAELLAQTAPARS